MFYCAPLPILKDYYDKETCNPQTEKGNLPPPVAYLRDIPAQVEAGAGTGAAEGRGNEMTRYLGVDPGYSKCGFGIVEESDYGLSMVESGVIQTPKDTPFPERINTVMTEVMRLLNDYNIDCLGVEHPVHGPNVTNSVEVGAAYGAVLLAGVDMKIPTLIHWPTQVKAAVSSGRASKAEVMAGVMTILNLEVPPKPDDTADALATAILTRDVWTQGQRIQ